MNPNDVYEHIQSVFRAGLVTIIGSGNSAGYGIPGMPQLAAHLISTMPAELETRSDECRSVWGSIADNLNTGKGLEEALTGVDIPADLRDVLANTVAAHIGGAEVPALRKIAASSPECAIGKLFSYILKTNQVADIITTNYDRILEFAAARSSVRVDTMYYGHTLGRLDERLSSHELLVPATYSGSRASARIRTRPHIRLAKPHGSLDWYEISGEQFRSDVALDGARRIIIPGDAKYRAGYALPYDKQRERATTAIDKASAFLTIGYGFNDDHLQTHLKTKFADVPCLVMARTLSPNAQAYLSKNPLAVGLQRHNDPDDTQIFRGADTLVMKSSAIWELDALIAKVLGL